MRLDKGCNLLTCVVIITLFKLCKDIYCQFLPGYSIKVKTHVTVQEHSCVSIPCIFTAENKNSFINSNGFWKNNNRSNVAASTNVNDTSMKSNFHMTGDPNKGDCTLTITDAKKKDSGTYCFRFEGHVMYNYKEKSETLTVTVTDPPKNRKVHATSANDLYCKFAPGYSIEVNTSVTVQERSWVTIPCSFTAGKRTSFKNARGFWKNNNKTTVAANFNCNDIRTKTNFYITGDPNKGDCTLTIIDAQKNDSGTYFYRLEGPLNYNYEAKSVTVIVTDPPKKHEVVITSANEGSDRVFDLLIGIVCGIAIVIFSILALKLIVRKYFKMNICLFAPMEYAPTEEPPAEDMVENDPNKMYMTVKKPKPKTKTAKDADKQQDSNNIPSDQEEIHYSTIVFKSRPFRASPMQPSAEYADIVK